METEAPAKSKLPSRTRGRPTKQDAEAIDRSVLDAAKVSFLTNGYGSTTMDEIARQAGVTKATLYQRYDDKAALLRAVMQGRISEWTSISDTLLIARGTTIEERLRHYAGSMTRWSRNPEVRAFGDLVLECWGSARPVAEEMQRLRVGRMLDVIERDIIALGATEKLISASPRLLADMFLGMVTGLHRHLEGQESWPDDDALNGHLDRLVGIFCSGKSAW